ncbi:hypothetical protein FPOA_04966 [Fusarium poae]|jgi:hypothetical protein|uniref:Uncharacterized protein n=1 Tax=Fusarium poae TaxID=36050 RepID=A0A1B8AVM2_FUSPO|nr:hypothetical protein FPOA_04966 [Fusarium poae]
MADATNNQVLNYNDGDIKAEAAFTAEILITERVGLQDVWHSQYAGSQVMGKRPGMYIKYLPTKYHPINGNMLTGGAYLFDTLDNANKYEDWTTNEFKVGEPQTPYWKQPLFKSVDSWTWKVIGAHNFTPVDEHHIGRWQRWTYHHVGVGNILTQLYPVLRDAAEKRGAGSFWLLHRPEDKMIGVQMSFPGPEGSDDDDLLKAIAVVASKKSVADVFPDALEAEVLIDRTSAYHAIWQPLVEAANIVKVACPNFPHLVGDKA